MAAPLRVLVDLAVRFLVDRPVVFPAEPVLVLVDFFAIFLFVVLFVVVRFLVDFFAVARLVDFFAVVPFVVVLRVVPDFVLSVPRVEVDRVAMSVGSCGNTMGTELLKAASLWHPNLAKQPGLESVRRPV